MLNDAIYRITFSVNKTSSNASWTSSKESAEHYEYVNRKDYAFGNYGYGKNSVKLLHVDKSGPKHSIKEYEVDVHLKLSTQIDYLQGDNRNIIATDSQKNTVYILAKKHGTRTPEEFGLLICNHFLTVYKHVMEVEVKVDEYPWERFKRLGEEHNHAFVYSPTATRFAIVSQARNGELLCLVEIFSSSSHHFCILFELNTENNLRNIQICIHVR